MISVAAGDGNPPGGSGRRRDAAGEHSTLHPRAVRQVACGLGRPRPASLGGARLRPCSGRHALGVLCRGRLPATRARACRLRTSARTRLRPDQRPAVLLPHQSSSPVPYNIVGAVLLSDPPLVITDMTALAMDPLGRLDWFHASSTARCLGGAGGAARLERRVPSRRPRSGPFHAGHPRVAPAGPGDARVAWTGTSAERPETPLRLEAASWRGRISFVPDGLALDAGDGDAGSANQSGHARDERRQRRVLLRAADCRAHRVAEERQSRPRRSSRGVAPGNDCGRRPTHHVGVQRPARRRPSDRAQPILPDGGRGAVCRRCST